MKQRLLRNQRLLARKITKRILSSKPASLNRPIVGMHETIIVGMHEIIIVGMHEIIIVGMHEIVIVGMHEIVIGYSGQ